MLPGNHDALRILTLGAPSVLLRHPSGALAGIDLRQADTVCRWLDIRPDERLLEQLSVIAAALLQLADTGE
ncbi:MAG: hypothetical protein F4147_12415 [Gammaproteobacteria bacterium]|nr:hypothetical protein [Gammaproteobacteria bacterium]